MRQTLEENRHFLVLVTAFMAAQIYLVHFIGGKPLLWDSSVYLAMGKWLFSLGNLGFWENFRPPVLPVLLGLAWKVGVPPGGIRLFSSLISAFGLSVVYTVAERVFGKVEALSASGILASSYVYFYFSLNPLTGIAASILVFLGIYLVVERRYCISGAVLGLAFLTRFPAALAVPAAVFYLLLRGGDGVHAAARDSSKLLTGFLVPVIPYLAAQYWFFGNILSPFVRSVSITAGAGNDYLYGLTYLQKAAKDNLLTLLSPLGIYIAMRRRETDYYGFAFALALFYGFFTLFPLKIDRYLLLFLPLMALFSGRVLADVSSRVSPDGVTALRILSVTFLVLVGMTAAAVYRDYNWENRPQDEFFREVSNLEGKVASNDPRVNLYGDFRYYPLPPGELSRIRKKHGDEIDSWAINERYWDCRGYVNCREQIKSLRNYLEENYRVSSKIFAGEYSYTIYSGKEQ